jgi:hypothetical protein
VKEDYGYTAARNRYDKHAQSIDTIGRLMPANNDWGCRCRFSCYLFNQQLQPYHRTRLDTANRLLGENQPALALVTAHMACAIYAEQVMSAAFKQRGRTILGIP